MTKNESIVKVEVRKDEVDGKWYFEASMPNFYNEVIEVESYNSKEEATEASENWMDNYKTEYPGTEFIFIKQ